MLAAVVATAAASTGAVLPDGQGAAAGSAGLWVRGIRHKDKAAMLGHSIDQEASTGFSRNKG